MIDGIAVPLGGSGIGGPGRSGMRRAEHLCGDFDFREERAACKLLDRAAIEVPCCKIHGGKIAACAQAVIDETYAFKQLRPVRVGYESQAGDDVADRQIGCALALQNAVYD